MNWYAMTGILDGRHYHRVFQADSLREAEAVFTELVFREIASGDYPDLVPEAGLEAVRADYVSPWIVAVVRTKDEPQFVYGA